MNRENMDILKGVPVAGMCVVSAIMKASDPRTAARELKQHILSLDKGQDFISRPIYGIR